MSANARARVAIVAMSCRLPGASTPTEMQAVLDERRTTPAPIPAERWRESVFAAELPASTRGPTRAGVLDEVPLDWRKLRLPPVDVERLHRMERAALATMSDALSEAALDDAALRAKTRIIVGATRLGADLRTDAARRIRRFELQGPVSDALDARVPHLRADIDEVLERLFNLAAPPIDPDNLAASASLVAGRVANLFDLQGGHVAIDAGMSSGLVAVETGITALASGQADAVLVCSLSPLLTPSAILAFAHRGLLTSQEHARPFDAAGDGTVLGEGAVALVLMREDDVGDRPVYAIIEGLGTADAGIDATPFSLERAVERAARTALAAAGDADSRVAAIETRSCGAPETDRGELAGLQRVYRERGALSVSSTVATFGLLPSAAGLVALLKAALAIKRGSFAAHAHDVAQASLRDLDVVTAALPLGKNDRIAVSDAGLGPIVAHCILGAPAPRARTARALPAAPDDAIAIVGLGARVPGADDIATLWRNVLERVDAIGDLPRSRFDVERLVGTSKDVGAILRTRLAATLSLPKPDPAELRLPSKILDDVDPSVLLALDVARQAMQDAGLASGDVDGARGRVVLGQLP
ncbi:MAG TPA: beta-ketoacyl synthase N-terminal-like domain-containing protein, partial [Myxococcota bacterium]